MAVNRTKGRKVGLAVVVAMGIAGPLEGLYNWAYLDPVGIPTNCFGTTRGVKLEQYKTDEECIALFTEEMAHAVRVVDKCVPQNVPLTVNQMAAFGSAVYNLGPIIVCDTKNSTAARLLNSGKVIEACNQLPRWNKAKGIELPGLTTRRAIEQEYCTGKA